MAEFCMQCAKEMFGDDADSDFTDMIPPNATCCVLCENCGILDGPCKSCTTIVDHQGVCIWKKCPTHGGDNNGEKVDD